MIFQDPASSLNPVLTIGDQIFEMFELHEDFDEEEARDKTEKMLKRVGLGHIKDPFEIYPHELSGGMKQRAMIAMALACNPKVLIADEPTTALDLTVQKEILLLLQELQQETQMALLIITHDLGVVAELADEMAVMYAGEIVEFGPCVSVFENTLHPYTKSLFAARPSPENRKKRLDGSHLFSHKNAQELRRERKSNTEKIFAKENKDHWAIKWTSS